MPSTDGTVHVCAHLAQALQRMCDALATSARGKRVLERSCGCFNCLFPLLGDGASDKSALRLLQRCLARLHQACVKQSSSAAMIGSGTFACANCAQALKNSLESRVCRAECADARRSSPMELLLPPAVLNGGFLRSRRSSNSVCCQCQSLAWLPFEEKPFSPSWLFLCLLSCLCNQNHTRRPCPSLQSANALASMQTALLSFPTNLVFSTKSC